MRKINYMIWVLTILLVVGCAGTTAPPMTPEEEALATSFQGQVGKARSRLVAASAVIIDMQNSDPPQISNEKALEYADKIEEANKALSIAKKPSDLESALSLAIEVLQLTGN